MDGGLHVARRAKRFAADPVRLVVVVLAVALGFGLGARLYLDHTCLVSGDSMNPSLYDGEWVALARTGFEGGLPPRGDIVVFRYPLDPKRVFVKRVVGLPGDVVEIRQGQVYVNDSFVLEDYRVVRDRSSLPATRVPEGKVFVLGDNRPVSEDSRCFGCVPLEYVRGVVFLVYWPPSRIDWLGALSGGSARGPR